jgi:gliding motility-associated-like protein
MFKSLFLILPLLLCSLVAKAQVGGPNYGNGKANGTITACAGTASVSPNIQQFTVSGNDLTSPMTISPPEFFELSLNPLNGYSTSVTITPVNGNIANTTVYARSDVNAPVGSISGRCIISTSGFTSTDPILSGTIYTLPVVNTLPNQVLLSGNATQPVSFTGTGNTYTWINDTPSIGLAASGSGNIAPFTAVNNGSNPVTATISVTAVAAGFAYIPNSGDGTVSVVNTVTNKIVTTIPVGSQPYGIVVTGGGATVYVTNQGSGTVSVIDTKTNTVIHTITVGSGPAGMSLTPDSLLFVVNQNDNTVGTVNTTTNNETTTRLVGLAPVNVLCSPDGTEIFVANSGSNDVTVLGIGLNTIATIPVGQHPSGMVLSPDGSTLYVGNANSNTISVISTLYNTVTGSITLSGANGPACIVISNDGNWLYVTDPASGTVSVVSTFYKTVTATIAAGQNPVGIAISNDGDNIYVANTGSNSVSVISTATNAVIAIIPVGAGPVSFGQFLKHSTGCESTVAKFTITVNPPTFPTITGQGVPSALTTTYGTASAATTFTVSGANVISAILVIPPAGFEISTDNANFGSTVTVGAAGNIAATTVYIRLASSTPVGNYTGNIKLSSTPAETVAITMPNSTVTPAPLTITADNKSKLFGAPNPALTVTYNGFVNNDTPEKLTTLPQPGTTAVIASQAGQYPISISGAASPNYTITYMPGVLTVLPPLFIPNTFTPNGDGINDKWEIDRLSGFTGCTVTVFNRYGQTVYTSTGYGNPWNGTYNGAVLPTGTYYYLINLKDGGPLLSGFVAIVR